MIALNTILADQLRVFKKDMEAQMANGKKFHDALFVVIKQYIIDSKRIRFEGNNYSEDWVQEADKRGLANIKTTPLTLNTLVEDRIVDLFERNKVLTRRELEARRLIRLEKFTKKIQIESRTLGDMATNHIIPIAIRYQNTLIENVKGLKEILDLQTYGKVSKNELDIITKISHHISEIKKGVDQMIAERKVANKIVDEEQIVKRATSVTKYYDDFIEYAKQWDVNGKGSTRVLKKKLYLAMANVNMLEGLRFYVSFACTFAFGELKLMEGSAKILSLIARDESQHLAITTHIIKNWMNGDDTEMKPLIKECKDEVI